MIQFVSNWLKKIVKYLLRLTVAFLRRNPRTFRIARRLVLAIGIHQRLVSLHSRTTVASEVQIPNGMSRQASQIFRELDELTQPKQPFVKKGNG